MSFTDSNSVSVLAKFHKMGIANLVGIMEVRDLALYFGTRDLLAVMNNVFVIIEC